MTQNRPGLARSFAMQHPFVVHAVSVENWYPPEHLLDFKER